MASRYVKVTGKGRFPEEMLANDNCEFATTHDEMRSYAKAAKRPRFVYLAKYDDEEWNPKDWERRGWILEEIPHGLVESA